MSNSAREILIIVEILLDPQEYLYMLISSKVTDLMGLTGWFFCYFA